MWVLGTLAPVLKVVEVGMIDKARNMTKEFYYYEMNPYCFSIYVTIAFNMKILG